MATDAVQVRPATLEDLTDIQSCAIDAYSKYIKRMDQKPAPMVADFSHQIDLGQVYVAFKKASFVGYVVFYVEADHLHLENIAVVPAQTGRGIGRFLCEYVEQTARDRGLKSVVLYTNEAMTENLVMYPKLGYLEIERKQQDGFNRVFFRKSV